MTTPSGDLPDWQTLVSPMIIPVYKLNAAGGTSVVMFTSPNPFRLWAMNISAEYDSTAAFAGNNSAGVKIQDGAGINLLAVSLALAAPSTVDSAELAMSVPGLTPTLNAGSYTVSLVVDAVAPNANITARGVIYYSQP